MPAPYLEAWFELIGDTSLRNAFQKIPRVRVIPAMPWPAYRDYMSSARYDVGLAPLLETPFNKACSHTKLYQITAAGAVGIFSDITPYSQKIIHNKTGILCSNDRDLWTKAIIALLKNKNQREEIYEAACSFIAEDGITDAKFEK